MASLAPGRAWVNWVGNQVAVPRSLTRPRSEAEVVAAVRAATSDGLGVRVAATGHSFTPVCVTDGCLIDASGLCGIRRVDASRRRVVAGAGTPVAAFGDALWQHGLALANQGDIDTQLIGGCIATATHGSGLGQQSFSATMRGCRMVTAGGDVIEAGEDDADLLHASQVAIGMLGVITEVELSVAPAYRLVERIEHWPFERVAGEWHERIARHRHFSLFWLPSDDSAALYGLPVPDGVAARDSAYVKIYDEAEPDEPDSATPGRRVDRAYRIYPAVFAPNFHEMEYMVPIDRALDAIRAMRSLMLARLPDSVFPLEVRTTAADEAFLSPNYATATCVLSVSGQPGTDYEPYLRDVDALLEEFEARPHWGKLHFMTRQRLARRYPKLDTFQALRRRFDPDGVFLNQHLESLFG